MTTRTIDLQLRGFGAPPARARAEIAELTGVIALPIPIVHFVLVPGGLLLAFTLGAWRLREGVIFVASRGAARSAARSSGFH